MCSRLFFIFTKLQMEGFQFMSRHSKESRLGRKFARSGATLAIATLALTGCASSVHEASSTNETPSSMSSGSAPAPTGGDIATIIKTPSMPPLSTLAGTKVVAEVCDGFFTQRLANGMVEVIGRPAVDANDNPENVEVNRMGVEISSLQKQSGEVTWYDIHGKSVRGAGELSCHTQTLDGRRLTQPNGSSIWVATTNNTQPTPRTWDAAALDPAGFAGVGLDYGPMSLHDLGDVLDQALRHHEHPNK